MCGYFLVWDSSPLGEWQNPIPVFVCKKFEIFCFQLLIYKTSVWFLFLLWMLMWFLFLFKGFDTFWHRSISPFEAITEIPMNLPSFSASISTKKKQGFCFGHVLLQSDDIPPAAISFTGWISPTRANWGNIGFKYIRHDTVARSRRGWTFTGRFSLPTGDGGEHAPKFNSEPAWKGISFSREAIFRWTSR